MKSFLEYMAEVEAPKSELDKKVFALHPVKIKEYPVANAGERDVKTSKDKSRSADQSPDDSKKAYAKANSIKDEDGEDPLNKPATDVAKQKIMKYFRSESIAEPVVAAIIEGEGSQAKSYNASFYGQFKRRVTKHEIPTKTATIGLTDSPDKTSEEAKKAKERLLLKVFGKKAATEVNEVSTERLKAYGNANQDEFNNDTHKNNLKKSTNRAIGFDRASAKRHNDGVKVKATDK